MARGAAQPHVYPDDLRGLKIPLPPKDVQTQIVAECEAVDGEVKKAKVTIAEAEKQISDKVADVYQSGFDFKEIGAISLGVQYGINEAMNESGVGYKIFRMNEIISGKMNDNGKMKYADISADEFEKYKLKHGDILFNRTNSIEHVGKTGIFYSKAIIVSRRT